jgi:hypothetical protein
VFSFWLPPAGPNFLLSVGRSAGRSWLKAHFFHSVRFARVRSRAGRSAFYFHYLILSRDFGAAARSGL